MLAVSTGAAAGVLHVLSGPDHLAALAPIAVDDRARAVRIGAVWGLGHGTGVVLLGAMGMGAGQLIDLHWMAAVSELAVGFLIIAIGLWSIRQAFGIVIHDHGHHHGPADHTHAHVHVGGDTSHGVHTHGAFGIGLLHGAAGSGHLFGVLPSLALPPEQAMVYLAAYVTAAVGSMAGFGWALGEITSRGGPRGVQSLLFGSGFAAMAVGVYWVASGVMA